LQIGSSPGFEDGEFESAKLLHPAASYYNAAEDYLYIVDSEVIICNCLPLFSLFEKYAQKWKWDFYYPMALDLNCSGPLCTGLLDLDILCRKCPTKFGYGRA
jgi:hypothetical protein